MGLDGTNKSRTYCSGPQTKDPATAGDTGRGLGADRLWQEVIRSRAVGLGRPARQREMCHAEPWYASLPDAKPAKTYSEAAVVETALVAGVRLDRSLRWSSLTDQTKPGQRLALTNRCLPPARVKVEVKQSGDRGWSGSPDVQRLRKSWKADGSPQSRRTTTVLKALSMRHALQGRASLHRGTVDLYLRSAGRKGRSHVRVIRCKLHEY